MLSNWSAYFDSKTGTRSFYEVDYKSLTLKCGSSLLDNYSFSTHKTATNSLNTSLIEFKGQFQTMLKLIREEITQQEPWINIKKVSKVIENIVAYTHIEESYIRKVSPENKDLQISPSFSFTIQRLIRLVKDVHLLCIYAKKKEAEEFKETRKVLKEAVRGVRKSALLFVKTYSAEQVQNTIDPLREILMAQFLQLVKFLVNFTKFEDHQAYVSFCSSGSSTKNLQDIWMMTDCSIKQSDNGNAPIVYDPKDNLSSLMHIQSKSRNSVVSTVHDLCSLGDILVKKRDFTKGSTTSQQECKASIGDLDGENLNGFGKQKSIRRRTANDQDRPDQRLLKETNRLYGNMIGISGVKWPRRANSLLVTEQQSKNEDIYEVREADESNFVIEEQSGEASPKKGRDKNLEISEVEKRVKEVIKVYNEEQEVEQGEIQGQGQEEENEPGYESGDEEELDLGRMQEEETIREKSRIIGTNNEQDITLTEIEEILIRGSNKEKENPLENLEEENKFACALDQKEDNEEAIKSIEGLKISQFRKRLRAVTVGRKTLLHLVKPEVEDNEEKQETIVVPRCPEPIVRSNRKVKTTIGVPLIRNEEIETAGLPKTHKDSGIAETAVLKNRNSQLSSPSPKKRPRSSSLDVIPRKSNGKEKRLHRRSRDFRKQQEDHCFTPKQQQEKRSYFLERVFGAQNKVGVERNYQAAYGLFHQKYEQDDKEREDDFRRKTELGMKRLACIPFVAPESWSFFEKLKVVRKLEAQANDKVTKDRVKELWDKVRQAVNKKVFLWKLGYGRNTDFPVCDTKSRGLLKCFSQKINNNLVSFTCQKTGRKEMRYIGPQRKVREVLYMKVCQGSFIPEEDRELEDDFNDLETNLMLARLSYNRKGKWGAAFSFKYRSADSRSKDVSRDISRDVSRDRSRDDSGSGLSSTKRGSVLKALFNTSAENSLILSPSNRSINDSKDLSWSAATSKSKPSLFKNLLKLHAVNEPSSASPRTSRSRASSKASIRENLNSPSSSPRSNGAPLSCPKRPSLFKSLFKSNLSKDDDRRGVKTSRENSTPSSPGWKTCRD